MKSSISLREVVAQLVAELGEQPLVGHDGVELVDVEPAQREARDERLGARVGEHALDLRFDDVGSPSSPAAASFSSSSSGPRLQRKNDKRDASSKSSSANVSPVSRLGRRNRAIQEIRAREHGRHELLDAGIEAARRAAVLVERHQPLEVVGVAGRRNARVASVFAMRSAQAAFVGGRLPACRRRSCRGSPCATGPWCRTALRLRRCR